MIHRVIHKLFPRFLEGTLWVGHKKYDTEYLFGNRLIFNINIVTVLHNKIQYKILWDTDITVYAGSEPEGQRDTYSIKLHCCAARTEESRSKGTLRERRSVMHAR